MELRRELEEAAKAHSGENKKMIARKDFDRAMTTLSIEESGECVKEEKGGMAYFL